jgi:NAD(P)-dependent dehydrogenase (short-subunit alcohol dehydrogenase family)
MSRNFPSYNLKGKRILLTGGFQGLGLSLAQSIMRSGASLVICGRSKSNLDQAKKILERIGAQSQTLFVTQCDVTNQSEIDILYSTTKSKIGNIDVLINNAGIIGPIDTFLQIDPIDWLKVFDVNLFGSIRMIRKFLPDMLEQGYGKIIQLSGGGATSPISGMTAYAASKTAIVRFIETISEEHKGSGVDFNSVAPGMMKTKLLDQMRVAGAKNLGEKLFDKVIKKSMSEADSMAQANELILFLCSQDSNGISGKLIRAEWDNWMAWPDKILELQNSDIYTLRRIIGKDRNFNWGDA